MSEQPILAAIAIILGTFSLAMFVGITVHEAIDIFWKDERR